MESNRRIVTRSKTGSLTPKQFMDSVATGASLKTSLAKISSSSSMEDVVVVSKEGELTRFTRSRAAASAMGVSVEKHSLYFKLGMCKFDKWGKKKLLKAQYSNYIPIMFFYTEMYKNTMQTNSVKKLFTS